MTDTGIDTIRKIIEQAAVYVPLDCEPIRISYCEEEAFYGTGTESGDDYKIYYENVNLKADLLYKYVLIKL